MTHKNDDNKDSAVDCVVTDNAVVNGITDDSVDCVITEDAKAKASRLNYTFGNAIVHGNAEVVCPKIVLDPFIYKIRED